MNLDISFSYIFSNSIQRFSVTSYGGISFSALTGYTMVLSGSTPTYYLIDHTSNRVIIFNKNWVYQIYQNLPLSTNSFALVYLSGFFYITSDSYFYKTDSNFALISSYSVYSRGIYYDSSSSLFYVVCPTSYLVYLFTSSLTVSTTISFSSYWEPHGIYGYGGNVYVSCWSANVVIVLQNKVITRYYQVTSLCSSTGLSSLTFDTFGYASVTCQNSNYIVLYDSNGNYLNKYMSITSGTTVSAIDQNGRLITTSYSQLTIYY